MTTSPAAATKLAPLPKARRLRIGIRLDLPILRRLREYAVCIGRKESAIVQDLVAEHLAKGGGRHTESSPPSPIDRLVAAIDDERAERVSQHRELAQALARIERELAAAVQRPRNEAPRELELLALAFGRFVRAWLGQQPELDAGRARYQAYAAGQRYSVFLQDLDESFRRGDRFGHVGAGERARQGARDGQP